MKGVSHPHSDALVITVDIGGIEIKSILVDNGRSCDILSVGTFSKTGICKQNLKLYVGDLINFTGHETPIMGMITFPLTPEKWVKKAIEMVDLIVFEIPSAFNVILGKSSQTAF